MQSVILFSDMPCSLGHTFGHSLEVYVITDQIKTRYSTNVCFIRHLLFCFNREKLLGKAVNS